MSIYAISDLHLSLNSQKPMDVFPGWENYTERLKENWTKIVSGSDTVVVAGDISWAMSLEEAIKDFDFINKLPGKKIFIKGNHDYWWSTKAKIDKFFKENGFNTLQVLHNSSVQAEGKLLCGTRGWLYDVKEENDEKILNREIIRLENSLNFNSEQNLEPIVFLHYPPVYGSEESTKIINILIERNVKKCYYGHIHGSDATKNIVEGNYKGINFKLISCDYLGFSPLKVA